MWLLTPKGLGGIKYNNLVSAWVGVGRWMGRWVCGWMGGQVGGLVNARVGRWVDGRAETHVGGWKRGEGYDA